MEWYISRTKMKWEIIIIYHSPSGWKNRLLININKRRFPNTKKEEYVCWLRFNWEASNITMRSEANKSKEVRPYWVRALDLEDLNTSSSSDNWNKYLVNKNKTASIKVSLKKKFLNGNYRCLLLLALFVYCLRYS